MRKILLSCALALVLASTLLAGPAFAANGVPANGVPAKCGQPILTNTTAYLTGDLRCSLSMAAGSTLNLNGHSLIGAGAASGDAIRYFPTPGLTTSPDITLKNGTITNWGRVFGGIDGPGVVLRRLAITHVTTAFSGFHAVVNADYTRFANNGAVVDGGIVGITVNHSTFLNNRLGISGNFAGFIQVANSTFTGNGTAIVCSQQQTSITATMFLGNTIAVNLHGCSGASVTDSVFTNNISGIVSVLFSPCGPCSDPVAQQAISDQFLRNRFQGNGVAVNSLHSATLVSNTFIRNTTALTSVALTDGSAPATIAATANFFYRNGEAVFLTNPAALKLNAAISNTSYGIFAPLAVDLGGNTACGNGISPECMGVLCVET